MTNTDQMTLQQARSRYPELANLSQNILTELAKQNFKCCVSGESVLPPRQEYWIIKYREEMAAKMGIQYSCMLPKYWDPQHEDDLDVLKQMDV